jgi:YHS domain-containing protein
MKKAFYAVLPLLVAVLFIGCQDNKTKAENAAQEEPMKMDMPGKAGPANPDVKERAATKAEIGKEEICPVTKEKFKVSEMTKVEEYKGKPYYMCCNGCPALFKADPEKYIGVKRTAKIAEVVKERTATKAEIGKDVVCPVMGTKFKVTAITKVEEYKGKPYFMCCGMCPPEFKKNPAKYAK